MQVSASWGRKLGKGRLIYALTCADTRNRPLSPGRRPTRLVLVRVSGYQSGVGVDVRLVILPRSAPLRRLILGVGAGLVLALGLPWTPALAQTPVDPLVLPASLERQAVRDWLLSQTDLDPEAVISIAPSNVLGLMAVQRKDEAGRALFRAQIRAEVLNAQTIREAANASWAADVDVDCTSRRGRVNRIIDFPLRNLQGPRREVNGSGEWVTPPSGTHLNTVVTAICEPNFRRPLAGMASASRRPAPPPVAQTASAAARASLPQAGASRVPASPPQTAPAQPQAPPAAPVLRPAAGPAAPATPATPPGSGSEMARLGLRPSLGEAPPTKPPVQAPPVQASPVQASRAGTAIAVQAGAVASAAGAERLASELRRALGSRLAGRNIRIVPVGGPSGVMHRVLIDGFATRAQASALCNGLQAQGRSCFLREGIGPQARMIAN